MGLTFASRAVFLCPKCQAPISKSEIHGVGVPLECQSCGTQIRLVSQPIPKWHKWAYIAIISALVCLMGVHNPLIILAAILAGAFLGGFFYAACVPPKVEVYHAWSGVPGSLIVPKEPVE